MAATKDDVRNYIVSKAAGLDTSSSALQVEVTWTTDNWRTHKDASGKVIRNTVRVRIIYQWLPEGLFGSVTMSSTSEASMAF